MCVACNVNHDDEGLLLGLLDLYYLSVTQALEGTE